MTTSESRAPSDGKFALVVRVIVRNATVCLVLVLGLGLIAGWVASHMATDPVRTIIGVALPMASALAIIGAFYGTGGLMFVPKPMTSMHGPGRE